MLDKLIPVEARLFVAMVAVAWLGYQIFDYGRDVSDKACALKQATGAAVTSETRRAEESATNRKRSEGSDDQIERIKVLEAERDAAAAAADRLREQVARTVRVAQGCAKGDPAAERSGQAVQALATVFAACEAEQRQLASEAAERYSTGLRCESDYSALIAGGTSANTSDKGSEQ